MNDNAAALLADMQAHCAAAEADLDLEGDDDVDLAPLFGARVAELGAQALVLHLLRTCADAQLTQWMKRISFAWRDFSYATWLGLLGDVAGHRDTVYQFLWFAGWALAWDVRRLDVPWPNVHAELRGNAMRNGGARPPSRETRRRLDDRFDYESVWERLAREGAPMLPGVLESGAGAGATSRSPS